MKIIDPSDFYEDLSGDQDMHGVMEEYATELFETGSVTVKDGLKQYVLELKIYRIK